MWQEQGNLKSINNHLVLGQEGEREKGVAIPTKRDPTSQHIAQSQAGRILQAIEKTSTKVEKHGTTKTKRSGIPAYNEMEKESKKTSNVVKKKGEEEEEEQKQHNQNKKHTSGTSHDKKHNRDDDDDDDDHRRIHYRSRESSSGILLIVLFSLIFGIAVFLLSCLCFLSWGAFYS